MLLTYRGSSYESSAVSFTDCAITGHYRSSSYQIQRHPVMPPMSQKLKYRGISYIPGVARRSSSIDGDAGWQPAIA